MVTPPAPPGFLFFLSSLVCLLGVTHDLQARCPGCCSHLLLLPKQLSSLYLMAPRISQVSMTSHLHFQPDLFCSQFLSSVYPPSDALKTHGSQHFTKYTILPSSLFLGISDIGNGILISNCSAISPRGVHSPLLLYLIYNQYHSFSFLNIFWFVHSHQLLLSLFQSSLSSLLPNIVIHHLLAGLLATRINRNN